jgi:DNA-binding SARP family transcriptional activator
MLKVLLLGRFEVYRDDRQITDWGGRQTRELVKILAAERPRPLSRDRLVDLLWAEAPPHAQRDVKVLVSRARHVLADSQHQIIATAAAGYVFGSGAWIDAEQMQRLVNEATGWERTGRPALAEAGYRETLSLYRGPFLAEDPYADWASEARERYRRLYLETLRGLGRLLFRRRHRDALGLAERLLAEDPFSDTAIQALLAALSAFGDASTALDAYDRFRRRLRNELGAAPALETEAYHTRLLRGQLGLDWPATSPAGRATPLAEPAPMVGRDVELRTLEEALERAVTGQAGMVVVTGEPGMGKTRLLEAFRARTGGRFWLLRATGNSRERHLPFQLLAEALRSLPSGTEEIRLAANPYADTLAELVPELALALGESRKPVTAQIARRRILEGFLHLTRSLAVQRPLVILLDDFQWSDPSTVDAVTFCGRRLEGLPVLWVIALRTNEPESSVIEDLRTLPNRRQLDLAPLSPEAVRQLVEGLGSEMREQIVREAAGVPFYVIEFKRALEEIGAQPSLPSSIQRAIQQRIGRMPVEGKHILEAAAVLGNRFSGRAVAALLETAPAGVLDILDELGRRQMVVPAGLGSDDFRFSHDLIRRAVYEGVNPARRRLLHGRAAAFDGADPAFLGRHSLQAGQPQRAVGYFRTAGDTALAHFATSEAEGLYQAALAAAEAANLGRRERVEILDRIGRARSARGDFAVAADAHQAALALARDEATAARQKIRLGWIAYYQHEPERAVTLARAAEGGGSPPIRGEALLLQAKLAFTTGSVDDGATLLARAEGLSALESEGELQALAVAVANCRGRFAESVRRFEAAADFLRQDGLLRPLVSAMLHAAIALAGRGDYVRALALLTENAELCRQAGAENPLARVPNTLATLYRELGQASRARDLNEESLALAASSANGEALAHTLVNLAELALDREDTASARRYLDRAAPVVGDPGIFMTWRIRLHWHLALGRLALIEDRPQAAWATAQTLLGEASDTASPKYEALSLILRGESLGPATSEGRADLCRALTIAQQVESPPLLLRAGLAVGRLLSGSEGEQARDLARRAAEPIAALLQEEQRPAFLAHAGYPL